MWGGSSHFFFVLPPPPPALCRVRVRMFMPLSEAQDYRFFVFVQFRPADALLSPEPGGDQGTLFAHNAVQGYIFDLLYLLLYVLFLFYVFQLNTHPPRGAVGGVTFHSGYLSFPHLTPTMTMVRGRFLA